MPLDEKIFPICTKRALVYLGLVVKHRPHSAFHISLTDAFLFSPLEFPADSKNRIQSRHQPTGDAIQQVREYFGFLCPLIPSQSRSSVHFLRCHLADRLIYGEGLSLFWGRFWRMFYRQFNFLPGIKLRPQTSKRAPQSLINDWRWHPLRQTS